MGPTWGQPEGRQDPGGPHVGPMNFAIWVYLVEWLHLESLEVNTLWHKGMADIMYTAVLNGH